MPIDASSARVSYAYHVQTDIDTPGSAAMKELRVGDGVTINPSRTVLESQEHDGSRQIKANLLGMHMVNADLNVQMSDHHDDFLESIMMGSFLNGTFSLMTVSLDDNSIVIKDDVLDNYVVGETFLLDEADGDDGAHTIATSKTTPRGILVTTNEDIHASTVAAGSSLVQSVCKLGSNRKFLGIEERYHDFHRVINYDAIMPNSVDLDDAADFICQMRFPAMIGKKHTMNDDSFGGPAGWLVGTAGASATDTEMPIDTGATDPAANDTFMVYPSTNLITDDPVSLLEYTVTDYAGGTLTFSPPLDVAVTDGMVLHFIRPATVVTSNDPFTTVDGHMYIGGVDIGFISQFRLTINNNLQPKKANHKQFITGMIPGRARVSGTFNIYLENWSLYNDFQNGTRSSAVIMLENTQSKRSIYLPRILYTGHAVNRQGDSPLMPEVPFLAEYDSTQRTTVRMTKVTLS